MATATYYGSPRTTYSCTADGSCDYEVHVLGIYKGAKGYVNVYLSGSGSSSRSLVLVLSSYERVQYTLYIQPGVVLSKVILVSPIATNSPRLCYALTLEGLISMKK